MAEENGTPKPTFEERMQAMAMHLELSIHSAEANKQEHERRMAEHEKQMADHAAEHDRRMADQDRHMAELQVMMKAQSENISSLITITNNLVIASQAHENRIRKLEQ